MRQVADRRRPSTALGRPATGLSPETTKKNVFEDIALAHREIYALYEIAQAMGTSLGVVGHDGAHRRQAEQPRAVLVRARSSSSTRTARRCAAASPPGIDAEVIQQIAVSNGEGLTGWVARNRRPLVNARPSADLEAAGLTATTTLQSALVCPLLFNDQFIGTLSVYHTEPGVLPRRSPPAARPRVGAGRRRHQELDALRADAVGLADRSADRPAEHALSSSCSSRASWRAPSGCSRRSR